MDLSVMPADKVQTKYGWVEIKPTSGSHIFVSSNDLKVNGVDCGASCHFYRWNDNSFHMGTESNDSKFCNEYQRKTSSFYSHRYPSTSCLSNSADKKLIEEFTSAVNQWASTHPDTIAQAATEDVNQQIEAKDKKIKELAAQIAILEQDIRNLMR